MIHYHYCSGRKPSSVPFSFTRILSLGRRSIENRNGEIVLFIVRMEDGTRRDAQIKVRRT